MVINSRFRPIRLIIRQIFNQSGGRAIATIRPFRLARRIRATPTERRSVRRGTIMVMIVSFVRYQGVINDNLCGGLFFRRQDTSNFPRVLLVFCGRSFRANGSNLWG